VGGGPTGLSLALGLARLGVRSVLLERNDATSRRSKAPGIHVRTREVLRQWGVEDRFLAEGELLPRLTMHDARPGRGPLLELDLGVLGDEAERPGLFILEQGRTEKLLLDAVRESGLCEVRFDEEVSGLEIQGEMVRLRTGEGADARSLTAAYVVGCDGASSFVRGALGLEFEGLTYSVRPMLADVRVGGRRDELPWPRVRNSREGFAFTVRLGEGLWRIVCLYRTGGSRPEEVTDAELDLLVRDLLGEGPYEREWASRFRIHRRSAARFRVGRVLLAGDAAHVHSPAGGLGMNSGIQDAHNLAWKLARALGGGEVDRLLESYEAERRAVVGGSVTRYADFLTRAILDVPPAVRALAFVVLRTLLRLRPLRRRMLRRTAMLDLHYPASSPLLERGVRSAGERLPDVLLRHADGRETRLHRLLPYAPSIIVVGTNAEATPDVEEEGSTVVRIGPAAWDDPSGLLARLLPGRTGWIGVRPDLHVERTGQEREAG